MAIKQENKEKKMEGEVMAGEIRTNEGARVSDTSQAGGTRCGLFGLTTAAGGPAAVAVDAGTQNGGVPSECIDDLPAAVEHHVERRAFQLRRLAGDSRTEFSDFFDLLALRAHLAAGRLDESRTLGEQFAFIKTAVDRQFLDLRRQVLKQRKRDAASIRLDEPVGEDGATRGEIINLEADEGGVYRMTSALDIAAFRETLDEPERGILDAVLRGESVETISRKFGPRRAFYDRVWPNFKAAGRRFFGDDGQRPAA